MRHGQSAVDEDAGQRLIKTNGVDLCTPAFGDPANPHCY